jgi:hypothetical protein
MILRKDPMKRWRLIIMPIIVVAIGLWVARPGKPPEVLRPGHTEESPVIDAPAAETLDEILRRDPYSFFPMSLRKYDDTIQGYAHSFDKHERINGVLRKPEKCEVRFREKPFAVHMSWTEGAGLASKVLFVEGENNGKMLARGWGPLKFLGIQTRDVDGADAKASGRFTIAQFGFKKSTERTLASMKRAKDNGKLFLKYEGIVPVEKLGGQKCHKFVRSPYDPPEEDQLSELTLYYDTEHWLQVGAILRDVKGQLLGEYFFSNVQINPEFSDKQFTRDAL